MELPRLETERLVLRAPSESDVPAMPGVFHDPDIYAYTRNIPYPYTPDDAVAAIDRYRRLADEGRAMTLFPELIETGEMIGLAVLVVEADRPVAELGYALGRRWWGRGYATEACRAMLAYGFGTLGLDEINAHSMVRNPASARVLEKLGMVSLGEIAKACEKDGLLYDAHGYVMNRAQWESR